MRLLIQRVSRAAVDVVDVVDMVDAADVPDMADVVGDGRQRRVGEIGQGLLVLAGFGKDDGPGLPGSKLWQTLCAKVLDLRIFPDDAGRLNLSLRETGGGLLLVSQFTLYADTRRGRRPSFTDACAPDLARTLYERLASDLSAQCPGPFATGEFGAEMLLDFVNWGPVTILLDSADFPGL